MDILQRYILKKFLANFLGANFLFIFLFVIAKYAEQVDQFIKISDQTPFSEFVWYFLYEIPFSSTYVYPMATLFSIVFMLGKMNEQNELYMLYATGKPIWHFIYPIVIFLLAFCLVFAIFNEEIVYKPHQKHRALHAKFRGQEYMKLNDQVHLVQFGTDDKLYVINYYHTDAKIMSNVKIFYITPETRKFENILMSEQIRNVDDSFWKVEKPLYYHFSKNGIDYDEGESITTNLGDTSFYFDQVVNPEDMSTKQVRAEAEKIEIIGGDHAALWTDYYLKTALPFIPLITLLIGIPLSIFTKRSVTVLSFVFAILGAFVYMVFLNIGVSLGKSGVLPPLLAGWLGSIVFFVAAIIAYRRLKI